MRRDGGSVFPARANTGDPKWPVRGLSGNEIARARISMMAGSTSALQSEAGYIDARPQIRQIDENLLRRTAGPYIWVKPGHRALTAALPLSPHQRNSTGRC